jgi:hypothetical protein
MKANFSVRQNHAVFPIMFSTILSFHDNIAKDEQNPENWKCLFLASCPDIYLL